MTHISDRKNMSVVLVACTPASAKDSDAGRAQPAVVPGQPVEMVSAARATAQASLPVALSSHEGLARVVRDILARGGYRSVEVGYCRDGYPSVEEAVEHAVARGVRRIVVMPMVFSLLHPAPCEYFAAAAVNDLPRRVAEIQLRHPDTDIVYAGLPFDHERQVDLLLSKIREHEPETFKAGIFHLGDLATGETGVVRELDGGTHFRSRMASLGFTPGVRVKMMQNYGHGAIIVSLRGTRVALGRGEACKVGVARRS